MFSTGLWHSRSTETAPRAIVTGPRRAVMINAVVEHKDVVIASLGASAGLAGLVLVFLGLVVSAIDKYPAGTKPAIVRKSRRPALAILVSFGSGIACVA